MHIFYDIYIYIYNGGGDDDDDYKNLVTIVNFFLFSNLRIQNSKKSFEYVCVFFFYYSSNLLKRSYD